MINMLKQYILLLCFSLLEMLYVFLLQHILKKYTVEGSNTTFAILILYNLLIYSLIMYHYMLI